MSKANSQKPEPVKVGESRFVHARSRQRDTRTVCGLRSNGCFLFKATTEPISCPFCQSVLAQQQRVLDGFTEGAA